jgi:hypothetical protein
MEPGLGAEEQATRRARRIARMRAEEDAGLRTQAEVAAAVEREQRQQRAWSQGAEGERLVAQTLELLTRYGWATLHDVHWPGRPRANIDHIAIGPGGVVVIDAKNWTGEVTVRDGLLRQNGYRRDDEARGVVEARDAVAVLLAPTHRMRARPVLCLAGQDQDPTRGAPASSWSAAISWRCC